MLLGARVDAAGREAVEAERDLDGRREVVLGDDFPGAALAFRGQDGDVAAPAGTQDDDDEYGVLD